MKRLSRFRPTPAMVVALVALVMAMGGSAYALTLPAGSVGSSQLRTHAVTQTKIDTHAVTPSRIKDHAVIQTKIAPRAVTTSRIRDATIIGSKIKDNTLTGNDIDEASLGPVPSTDTVGRYVAGACNPISATYVNCGTVTLAAPHAGRVALTANAQWFGGSGGNNLGQCTLTVDGKSAGSVSSFGEVTNSTDATHPGNVGLNLITDPVPVGAHTFAIVCNEQGGSIDVPATTLSAVLLGAT